MAEDEPSDGRRRDPKRQPRPATPAELRDAIRDEALRLGFDAVGFAPADLAPEARRERLQRLGEFVEAGWQGDMGWLGERAEERADPQRLWRDAKTVVSLALNYAPAGDPLEVLKDGERAAISVYAQGRDYHEVMKSKLKALGRFIWDTYRHDLKVFVDTAPLMEKPAGAGGRPSAGRASTPTSCRASSAPGCSWARSCCRSSCRADAPETDHCGQCRACLDICPTNAFPAPYQLDARRCISYLTIEHEGPIDARVPRRCSATASMAATIAWRSARGTSSPRQRARRRWRRAPALDAPLLAELATLDDAGFRTPLRRHRRSSASAATASCATSPMRWATAAPGHGAAGDRTAARRRPPRWSAVPAVWASLAQLAPTILCAGTDDDESDESVRDEWSATFPEERRDGVPLPARRGRVDSGR